MKKRLVLLFVLIMTVLSACSSAPKVKPIIAICLGDLDDPFMLQMEEAFTKNFGEKYDIQVASAENDSSTQVTQIENFTALGVKFMFVIPVDPSTLTLKLKAARKAGIQVLVAGGDPGSESRDAILKIDQYLTGEYVTIMAREWIKKTYPEAEVKSIQTVILSSNQNNDSILRSKGLTLIAEEYLVNEKGQYINSKGDAISSDKSGVFYSGFSGADRVINPFQSFKVRIVANVEANSYEEGQQVMRDILTEYPDVKLVLAYSSDVAQGASAAVVEAYGNNTDVTYSIDGIAVFGVGLFGLVEESIIDASMSGGVFRGAVAYGGVDFSSTIIDMAKLMLEGKSYPAVTWEELALVSAIDGQLSIEPVTNTGFIQSR